MNPFYPACPAIVQEAMDKFAELTGREYQLFDYVGAPDAERVVIIMGSGAEAAHETVEYLDAKGEKVGVLKVRLYRPFSVEALRRRAARRRSRPSPCSTAPRSRARSASRSTWTSSPPSPRPWPRARCRFDGYPVIVGGRYGLGSKEFTPAMVKAVFDNLDADKPKNHFTVGINDDVTTPASTTTRPSHRADKDVIRAMFYGLGSDGTVGANKNSIKIIGEETDNYAQGYFVYDSKKAGAMTISPPALRPEPITLPT